MEPVSSAIVKGELGAAIVNEAPRTDECLSEPVSGDLAGSGALQLLSLPGFLLLSQSQLAR